VLVRRIIHILVAILFLLVIIVFAQFHNKALITIIFTVAGYTYGPILGLFAFGIFSKREIEEPILIPFIALLSPLICYFLSRYSTQLFMGYRFGFELLIVNGLITFLGLWLISIKKKEKDM